MGDVFAIFVTITSNVVDLVSHLYQRFLTTNCTSKVHKQEHLPFLDIH